MTYKDRTLNRICKDFCPICGICSTEYECKDRVTIRQAINRIEKDGDEILE